MEGCWVKEEVGHIPGRFVLSVVNGNQTLWQKPACFHTLEQVRGDAFRAAEKYRFKA